MYICQICKKAPATIHLTDIHNNLKKEVHICESCAAEKGFNVQGAASLPQLLGLAAKKAPQMVKARAKPAEKDLVCLECGSTWSQFGERGRLGCPHDYQAFDLKMMPLIASQIARGGKHLDRLHVGKRPGPVNGDDERGEALRSLEKKLRRAVAEENYEAAAGFKKELDALREAE